MHMDHAGADLNDVEYDAYLANDRTLDDPAVIAVERGGRVRLRLINGGSSTNFTIDLGSIRGSLVAVDGNPIVAVEASRFPLGIAQRADIELTLPAGGAAVPVLALGEGTAMRAGIILKPAGAAVSKVACQGRNARSGGRARAGTACSRRACRCGSGQSTAPFPSSSTAP